MNSRARQRRTFSGFVIMAAIAGVLVAAPLASSAPGTPPTAAFTANPNPAAVNQLVTFDGSGSTGDGSGGAVASYQWDLDGDGSFETNTGAVPTASRSYSAPTTISVTLRVTDSEGDFDDASAGFRVNASPSAGFIFEPSTPGVNEQITYSSSSSDPDGVIASGSHRWDFDADGQFDDAVGETVANSFPTPGERPVSLEVTDADGATAVTTRNVLVQSNPPAATFTFSPASPLSQQDVAFDGSRSAAPPGESIVSMTWDVDGDGEFDDASGPVARFAFRTPGPRTVSLRVASSGGGIDIERRVVEVRNRPPKPAFTYAPKSLEVGKTLRLTSTSTDADSPIVKQSWDLDGDGEYDDADGPRATKRLGKLGGFTVGLRVVDAEGSTRAVRKALKVTPPAQTLLSPFPVVRLAGTVLPGGRTEIERLIIRAPDDSRVTVHCKGQSCPFKARERAVQRARIRVRELERALGPRTVIKIYVTAPDQIGKFAQFKLREGKAPKRVDACVEGTRLHPIPCRRS